jgi:hypothetical protein
VARLTRRAALAALGAGGVLGAGYALRALFERSTPDAAPAGPDEASGGGMAGSGSGMMGPDSGSGMMGSGSSMMGSATGADMSTYMDMFNRHTQLRRVVEEIPGGVRTTTESDFPDLVAQLQAHVSSMYSHLEQRAEVTCMSQSLPTLFRHAADYRRQISFTPRGVVAEETSSDPEITRAIRAHATEVTGFVREGMPAMMNQMMRAGR